MVEGEIGWSGGTYVHDAAVDVAELLKSEQTGAMV
jgi:hypothetical protein